MTIATRNTKYGLAVLGALQHMHHATNIELVNELRKEFPEVSKTTIHRVTGRLLEQGKIRAAPPTHDNAARFDSNVTTHDHFSCKKCDRLRDIQVPLELLEEVQSQLGKCRIDGNVVLSGICGRCSGHVPSSGK